MTLASTRRLMRDANVARIGVGAFNVIHLETAEALVSASERAQLPVILQISQNCAVRSIAGSARACATAGCSSNVSRCSRVSRRWIRRQNRQ